MPEPSEQFGPIRVQRSGGIATVVIDNPPVNASSWDVRRGLLTAIEQMSADPSVSGIVLIGAGKTFIAGADIKEFDGPLRDPQMPAVIAAVEACAKPVVAAIHGAALGAGYELALGCDARIVAADAIVGLPEVMLGIIPGAGGTQRLPRLVGLSAAIDLITAGRRVKANEAVALGMVDAMSTGDLHADAVQLARSVQGRKRRLSELDVPAESDADIAAAADRAIGRAKGAAAIVEAITAIQKAATLPFAQALAEERATFQRLRQSTEAAAKRYLFFAERDAFRVPGIEHARARAVTSVGVVGAGTMGVGIAICFLDAGLPVTLIERDRNALDADWRACATTISEWSTPAGSTARRWRSELARVTPSTDLAALADADLGRRSRIRGHRGQDDGVPRARSRPQPTRSSAPTPPISTSTDRAPRPRDRATSSGCIFSARRTS